MPHEEEGMDKYGVDEGIQDALDKYASTGCPQCGTPADQLIKHGSVLMCPRCGSEPFEKR